MKFKTLAQGYGAAVTVLILRIWPHLSSYHPALYHSFLPLHNVLWGLLLDLGVVTLLATLLFHYLQAASTALQCVLWAFVMAALATKGVAAAEVALHHRAIPLSNAGAVALTVLFGDLALIRARPAAFKVGLRVFTALLTVGGCSLLWMLPKLLYQAVRVQKVDQPVPTVTLPPSPVQSSPTGNRLVWILFDELSYDQTFEHRFPGLALPAFDAFRRSSVVFQDLEPAGFYTDLVIPSFFLGELVGKVRSDLDGVPSLQLSGSKQWQPFHADATLFADAQRLGWTTGVVGWYNPYCRILAGTLNACYWRMGDSQLEGAFPERSILQNAIAPIEETFLEWRHMPNSAQQRHAADITALMPQAIALLRNTNIGFVFIHLPVPHPPNIARRVDSSASKQASYLDNLVIADKALAELMRALNKTPAALRTTVIVCSDHSWRVPAWRGTRVWTEEDETASHGFFDTRPVLLIHSPGQQLEIPVTTPFNELGLHAIIERLLLGQPPLGNGL